MMLWAIFWSSVQFRLHVFKRRTRQKNLTSATPPGRFSLGFAASEINASKSETDPASLIELRRIDQNQKYVLKWL